MQRIRHRALSCLLLLAFNPMALAQPVYRCGNSYSQTPCTGAVPIAADDTRTDAQRTQAKQALSSDKKLSKDLEAARRQDEARELAERKQAQTATQHAKPQKADEKKESRKPAPPSKKRSAKKPEPAFFTATDGATGKKPAKKASAP
jgi:hypothetical protein